MTELLHAEIAKVEALVQAGVALMALIMIVVVWGRTKAFVPTIGAVLFGALVTWAVHNVDFLQAKVDEEFQSLPASAVVHHVEFVGSDADEELRSLRTAAVVHHAWELARVA